MTGISSSNNSSPGKSPFRRYAPWAGAVALIAAGAIEARSTILDRTAPLSTIELGFKKCAENVITATGASIVDSHHPRKVMAKLPDGTVAIFRLSNSGVALPSRYENSKTRPIELATEKCQPF